MSPARQILFDHLIRPHKYTWRNCKAEDLACFQVNEQRELGWPLYRQVGWLGALKDPVDVSGGSADYIRQICTVRHQSIRFHTWMALRSPWFTSLRDPNRTFPDFSITGLTVPRG